MSLVHAWQLSYMFVYFWDTFGNLQDMFSIMGAHN